MTTVELIEFALADCGSFDYCKTDCSLERAIRCNNETQSALKELKKRLCIGCANYNDCTLDTRRLKNMLFHETCYMPEAIPLKFKAEDFYPVLDSAIEINLPRGFGKTTLAMKLSEKLKYPILVATCAEVDNILEKAIVERTLIPVPIVLKDLKDYKYKNKIIVDNIECFDKEFIDEYKDRIYAYTTTAGDMKIISDILS